MVRKLSNEQKQYVFVDNQASSMQLTKCGVPQGSVLEPVLLYATCQTCLSLFYLLMTQIFSVQMKTLRCLKYSEQGACKTFCMVLD